MESPLSSGKETYIAAASVAHPVGRAHGGAVQRRGRRVELARALLRDADDPVALAAPAGRDRGEVDATLLRVLPEQQGLLADDVSRADADQPVRRRRPGCAQTHVRRCRLDTAFGGEGLDNYATGMLSGFSVLHRAQFYDASELV